MVCYRGLHLRNNLGLRIEMKRNHFFPGGTHILTFTGEGKVRNKKNTTTASYNPWGVGENTRILGLGSNKEILVSIWSINKYLGVNRYQTNSMVNLIGQTINKCAIMISNTWVMSWKSFIGRNKINLWLSKFFIERKLLKPWINMVLWFCLEYPKGGLGVTLNMALNANSALLIFCYLLLCIDWQSQHMCVWEGGLYTSYHLQSEKLVNKIQSFSLWCRADMWKNYQTFICEVVALWYQR